MLLQKINIHKVRDIYISKLQTSRTMKLNNHNTMFDHVYTRHIFLNYKLLQLRN
jgi:hypothetical protein